MKKVMLSLTLGLASLAINAQAGDVSSQMGQIYDPICDYYQETYGIGLTDDNLDNSLQTAEMQSLLAGMDGSQFPYGWSTDTQKLSVVDENVLQVNGQNFPYGW